MCILSLMNYLTVPDFLKKTRMLNIILHLEKGQKLRLFRSLKLKFQTLICQLKSLEQDKKKIKMKRGLLNRSKVRPSLTSAFQCQKSQEKTK